MTIYWRSYIVALTLFFFVAEVVLSLLIESFEFTPSKKEIFWQLSKLVTPIVVGEGTKPQLPMVVKLVHREKSNFGLGWFGVYYLTSESYIWCWREIRTVLCIGCKIIELHSGMKRKRGKRKKNFTFQVRRSDSLLIPTCKISRRQRSSIYCRNVKVRLILMIWNENDNFYFYPFLLPGRYYDYNINIIITNPNGDW